MYKQNLHTHGPLCDGKNDYEDTIKRAMELGLNSIGFSMHSYAYYSPHGGGTKCDNSVEYKKIIRDLQQKYDGVIDVFCGLELDAYSQVDLNGYDYIIGSFHYFKIGDNFPAMDTTPENVKTLIDTYFDGDGVKYYKEYFRQFAEMPNFVKKTPDIVGHFDIIAKHDGKHNFFDTESKEYRNSAIECAHALAEKIKVFELNTGGLVRGYRDYPYLPPFLLKELKAIGAGVVISSDCHDNRFLNAYFSEAEELLKSCGFDEALVLTKNGFKGVKL